MTRPKSVIVGRDPEVLQHLLDFYCKPGARVLDVTANERRMWKGVTWSGPVTYMDLDPAMKPDFVGDFRNIPRPDGSFDAIVFDPPHLPRAAGTASSMQDFARIYGLGHSLVGDNVSAYFVPFLLEAERVLTPEGMVFAKLCDFVHNHAHQWSLVDFVNAVRSVRGLTPCSLRVKCDPSAGNLASGQWEKVHHPRNAHAWWAVVRKGRCEPAGA